eukprot:CAMPEP_0178425632 /NCGR_PEP_ID=MMETSP0689_2-20121128/28822_1 /TAXON_ID=160604 /ORGANISM="Amphidinium massartii, Strain CS-259" /LENGTH=308 /DNA_ID=CAMNT_0020047299 /DNA_START=132 /DNA_END=1055 /DNA_ORIENTATION=+
MEGGGIAQCGQDGLTCATFLVAPDCTAVTIPSPPTSLRLGDICDSAITNASADCPPCTQCLSLSGYPLEEAGIEAMSCQLTDVPVGMPAPLQVGDICRSGGVETGPGINRRYDCPIGSSCQPEATFAIGGEVNHTCQEAQESIPSGGQCTLSGTRGMPAVPCEKDHECVIIDAGRPEVDIPNIGICLMTNTSLPVSAACAPRDLDGSATPCAPKLACTWTAEAFPSHTGYTCQPHSERSAAQVERCATTTTMSPSSTTDASTTEGSGSGTTGSPNVSSTPFVESFARRSAGSPILLTVSGCVAAAVLV